MLAASILLAFFPTASASSSAQYPAISCSSCPAIPSNDREWNSVRTSSGRCSRYSSIARCSALSATSPLSAPLQGPISLICSCALRWYAMLKHKSIEAPCFEWVDTIPQAVFVSTHISPPQEMVPQARIANSARSPSPPCTLLGGVEPTMTSMAQLNALALLVLLLTASLPIASTF